MVADFDWTTVAAIFPALSWGRRPSASWGRRSSEPHAGNTSAIDNRMSIWARESPMAPPLYSAKGSGPEPIGADTDRLSPRTSPRGFLCIYSMGAEWRCPGDNWNVSIAASGTLIQQLFRSSTIPRFHHSLRLSWLGVRVELFHLVLRE